MKVNFFQRIGVRISFLPLFFLLVLYLAGGMGFYYFSPTYFVNGFHTAHLVAISSEKKQAIDSWFDYAGRTLGILSGTGIIRDNAAPLAAAAISGETLRRKTVADLTVAQTKISAFLAEAVLSSPYNFALLLSPGGKVIAGNKKELLGADWSGKELFRKAVAELKGPAVAGPAGEGSADAGMAFMAPIHDADGKTVAVLYAVAAFDDLSRHLKVTNTLYKSENIELIDSDGNLLLTGKGFPDRKIRYNLPNPGRMDGVRLKDDLFFYVTALEKAPFRLISTVGRAEVMGPYETMLVLYYTFGGLLLLIMLIEIAIARRLINRPVAQMVHAVESVGEGDLEVDIGEGFKGELLVLKKAFANMLAALGKKASVPKEGHAPEGDSHLTAVLYPRIAAELKAPIAAVITCLDTVLGREKSMAEVDRKLLEESSGTARSLLNLVDGLLDLSHLEQGKQGSAPGNFDYYGLLREVEGIARELVGTKDIEVVSECHESLAGHPVYLDRTRLKEVLVNLTSSAVRSARAGTVTIFSTVTERDGVPSLEISVADAAGGSGVDVPETVQGDFLSAPSSLGLATARQLVEAMGGSMAMEMTEGKGNVFTIILPMGRGAE
jgi:signal transduction histidine kinase